MTKHLPDAFVRAEHVELNRAPRLVQGGFGRSLQTAFSGISWYLSRAGTSTGMFEGAFTLQSQEFFDWRQRSVGGAWKLQRILTRRKAKGFKFTGLCQDVLWSQYQRHLENMTIISNYQILGKTFLKSYRPLGIKPFFYVDGTLSEFFYSYGQVEEQTFGPDLIRQAIELEKEGYQHAVGIMTMSHATTRNLIEVYGVEPQRIRTVLPGANIDDEDVPNPSGHTDRVEREFTLGFVGLYPYRKGLDKLAEAVRILRGRDVPIRLRVIGRCPDGIASMDGVDFLGMIDKRTEISRFVEAIRTVDLGCQLSRAELLGIAVLEFMRVGVPVLATAVGGMPDVLRDGGGVLVPADVTVEQLAEELQSLVNDQDRYGALKRAAMARAEWASWRRTARDVDAFLTTAGC